MQLTPGWRLDMAHILTLDTLPDAPLFRDLHYTQSWATLWYNYKSYSQYIKPHKPTTNCCQYFTGVFSHAQSFSFISNMKTHIDQHINCVMILWSERLKWEMRVYCDNLHQMCCYIFFCDENKMCTGKVKFSHLFVSLPFCYLRLTNFRNLDSLPNVLYTGHQLASQELRLDFYLYCKSKDKRLTGNLLKQFSRSKAK